LTIEDAEAMMGFEPNFTACGCGDQCGCVSDKIRMKMLGNGIHLQVLRYIFEPVGKLFPLTQ
jgi:hypothetical protein